MPPSLLLPTLLLSLLLLLVLPTPTTAAFSSSSSTKTTTSTTITHNSRRNRSLFYPGSIAIIPQDNRTIFYEAFAAAKKEIRIEICVLEDPDILSSLQAALERGVVVRVIVDHGKYYSDSDERDNLETYLTDNGGILHVSNPIFPRSFPKVILIDEKYVMVGSACLDSTTFESYRDYVYVSNSRLLLHDLSSLFENDWTYSRPPALNNTYPPFNPTPRFKSKNLMVGPTTATDRYVSFLQEAKKSLDITAELWGNPTLQSEVIAAVDRGVYVRVIAPLLVNSPNPGQQQYQNESLAMLQANGVSVHVTLNPQNETHPYMHARTAVRDAKALFIGSISYSMNSTTFNREVGVCVKEREAVERVRRRFEEDWVGGVSVPLVEAL